MARPMGPRFKIARSLGVNVFDHPKALKRGPKVQRKISEYGKQLREKQKLKAYYGMMEKQFKIYAEQALSSKQNPGEKLVQRLEQRLDNLTYRLGFASTLRQARQMVVHGHIRVNGKKIDRPSYKVDPEDVLSLSEKAQSTEIFKQNFDSAIVSLPYLQKHDNYSGTLVSIPAREQVPIDVTDSLIIEFYSR